MAEFSKHIDIHAPADRVWAVLADIGSIHEWNPGVDESYVTSGSTRGLGAKRRCNLSGDNYLDEEVVEWIPKKKITMRINDTDLPFKRADINFYLKENDGTTSVTVQPNYQLKFGVIGKLLDRLFVRRTYGKGMEALLEGLKDRCESYELRTT